MIVLGIETSCDETSAAIVKDGKAILSHVIKSQTDIHKQYGGVVPEVASRSHLEALVPVLTAAFKQAFAADLDDKTAWEKIDAIAVTKGPGLSGGLLMGAVSARALAWAFDKPLYGVNHVLGHTFANFIANDSPKFPLLSLTASGGHTQLLLLRDLFEYEVLGQTQDDAVGEAFDKVAKMLGLSYPGGPSISRVAENGDRLKYRFPIAQLSSRYDFSFSGLKTAILRELQTAVGKTHEFPSFKIAPHLSSQQIADFAASFEHTAITTLIKKLSQAITDHSPATVVIGGGVAANKYLQQQLSSLPAEVKILPAELCTDNGAMIACLGYFQAQHQPSDDLHNLLIQPSLSL